jgi:hypothetical protein
VFIWVFIFSWGFGVPNWLTQGIGFICRVGSKFGLCELVDEDDDLVTPQTSRNATTSLGLRRRVLNKLGSVVSKNPWFPKSHFPSLNPQFLGSNNGKSPFEDPFGGFFQWGIPKSPRVHSYSNALTTWMIWGNPHLGTLPGGWRLPEIQRIPCGTAKSAVLFRCSSQTASIHTIDITCVSLDFCAYLRRAKIAFWSMS